MRRPPPGALPRAPRWLTARPYAHRGLHGVSVPENGLAAFRAAVDRGHGIECDVRLAADGVPFVFHDARLERLTGASGRFEDRDSAAIAALRLADGGAVPSLADLLRLVAGRAPVLIEFKTGRPAPDALCRAVAVLLDGHDGPAAVMSFDPRVPAWFARHRPRVTRGLVLSRHGLPPDLAWRRHALAIGRARPHFLACDIRDLPDRTSRTARRQGRPVLVWTVRTGAQRARACRHADQIIFESGQDADD